jgi:hypothetical protein
MSRKLFSIKDTLQALIMRYLKNEPMENDLA